MSQYTNELKKEKIDQMISEFLSIEVFDLSECKTTINKKKIKEKFLYKQKALADFIFKSYTKYKYYYDFEILRDECIASYYESLLIVAADISLEEIHVENKQLIYSALNHAKLSIKNKLISYTISDTKGRIIKMDIKNESEMTTDNIEFNIEDCPNESKNKYYNSYTCKYSKFLREYKDKILTKKQLSFIDNNVINISTATFQRLKNRIRSAYEELYKS